MQLPTAWKETTESRVFSFSLKFPIDNPVKEHQVVPKGVFVTVGDKHLAQ